MKHFISLTFVTISIFHLFSQDWIPLHGPIASKVWHSIIRKETNEIFAFTVAGEVFLSSDKGLSWYNVSKGIAVPTNPVSSASKLVESKDGKLFLYNDRHLYQYNPSDSSWISNFDGINIQDYAISPNGAMYVAVENFLYISYNDGKDFFNLHQLDFTPRHFECKGNGSNFAFKNDTTLVSFNDDGSNLQILDTIKPTRKIIYDENSGNLLNFTRAGIYISGDGGFSWHGINIPGYPSQSFEFALQMPNGNLLAIGNPNFISEDGGVSWNVFHFFKSNPVIFSSHLDNYGFNYANFSNDLTLVLGNSSTPYIQNSTTDAKILVVPGRKPSVPSAICYGEKNILCIVDGEANNSMQFSEDDGVSWVSRDSILSAQVPLIAKNMDSQGNYYSFDFDSLSICNFENYSKIRKPYPNTQILAIVGGTITKSGKVIVADEFKTYLSDDMGTNWQNYPVAGGFEGEASCSANDIIYNGTNYSLDYGKTWQSFSISPIARYTYYFLSKNNVYYWVEEETDTAYKLHSSEDFGINRKLEDPTNLEYTKLIKIDDDDNRYFETRTKLIIRHHANTTEDSISYNGLNTTPYDNRTFYFGQNGYIYCARPNTVLYRTVRPVTRNQDLSDHKLFFKAFPNPCIEETRIVLPESFITSKYQLTISNLLGQVIHTYYNSERTFILNCSQLMRGCYLVNIENTQGQKLNGKIIVAK